MPIVSFEVIVGIGRDEATSESVAIAQASKWLAFSDTTNTFSASGNVTSIDVYGGGNEDWGIALHFDARIQNDAHLKEFMDELVVLSYIESVEILNNPNL